MEDPARSKKSNSSSKTNSNSSSKTNKKKRKLASGTLVPSQESTGGGGEKRGFYVDLASTNTVSWKQLTKSAKKNSSNNNKNEAALKDKQQVLPGSGEEGGGGGGGVAPPPSRGDSKLDSLKKKFGFMDQGENRSNANPLSSVIQKIERMYGGAYASDSGEDSGDEDEDEGREGRGGKAGGKKGDPQNQKQKKKRSNKEDEYDLHDDFLDDSEIVQYYDRQKSKPKHDGFFINKGKLETDGDADGGTDRDRTTNETDDFKPKKKKAKKKVGQIVKGKSKAGGVGSSSKLGVSGGGLTKKKKKKKVGTIASKLIADVNNVAVAPSLKRKQKQKPVVIEESENEGEMEEMVVVGDGAASGGQESDATESEEQQLLRPAPKPLRKIAPKPVTIANAQALKPKTNAKTPKQQDVNDDLTVEISHTESDEGNADANNGKGEVVESPSRMAANKHRSLSSQQTESGEGVGGFSQEEEEALQHVNNLVEETLKDDLEAKKIKQRKIKRVPVNIRNIFPKLGKIWAKQNQAEKRRFLDCLMVKLDPFVEETSFRTKLNLLSAPYRLEQLRTTMGKENANSSQDATKKKEEEVKEKTKTPPKSGAPQAV